MAGVSNLQRKTRLRSTGLSRSASSSLTRTAYMVPCGAGWPDEEQAKAWLDARGREGYEVYKCWRARCPKWHVQAKPVPVRAVPGARPRRETGFPPKVKLDARKRSGGGEVSKARCEACGTWLGRYGGEIQHRYARGSGGCRSAVVNGTANACVLCLACHRLAEARDEGMRNLGFWIRRGKGREYDPRYVPIARMGASGERETCFLTESGEYSPEPPSMEAVA